MSLTLNLCTAILPKFLYGDTVKIAVAAGYQGIELRVDDHYHKSLEELSSRGASIRRKLDQVGLRVPILNSYISVNNEHAIDLLLYCCQKMNIPKARIVLPRSCRASVSHQANVKAIIPSYEVNQKPEELINELKKTLKRLEGKARQAGVKLLLELHWGTVMSSFTSAYLLTQDLDPDCIGITFDPANMLVEGKEDWEFGLKLIRPYVANVHVKNVAWTSTPKGWLWGWTTVMHGMVNWAEIISLLTQNQYQGDYAIEDFLTPSSSKPSAINYLTWVRAEFEELHEHFGNIAASHLQDVAS